MEKSCLTSPCSYCWKMLFINKLGVIIYTYKYFAHTVCIEETAIINE